MTVCSSVQLSLNCSGSTNEHPGSTFGSKQAAPQSTTAKLAFDQDTIRADLTTERPVYKLSVYGPAKYEPSLITGHDTSPEELRAEYYKTKGDPNQNREVALYQGVEQQIQTILSNLPAAYEYASNQSPNRTAQMAAPSAFGSQTKPPTFGSTAFGQTNTATSTFGAFSTPSKPTAFGQPSTFGTPAAGSSGGFGAFAPKPAASAFGQPTFGSSAATPSAFGKPVFGSSTPQQPVPSAFGSTSTPSAFGGSAFGKPTFGQPSATTSAPSAFGSSPGGFGAFANKPVASAFGQPQQAASTFGSTSQPAPAFGSTSQPSTFGASTFGNNSATVSAFGSAGTSQATSTSGAVQPTSTFGAPSQPTSAFGAPAQPTSTFGFGSSQAQPAQTSGFSAFSNTNAPAAPSAFGASAFSRPAVPSAFGSQPAASASGQAASTQLVPDLYGDAPTMEELPADVQAAFKADKFTWGNIPSVIPPISVR